MAVVTDTLTYADHSLVNGQVVVSWPAFQMNGTPVAGGMLTVPIEQGAISVDLYSNINARPAGVYYTAVYELDEGKIYTEYWIIPALPTVTIGQIRIDFPVQPSAMVSALQLTSGGAAAGMFLGWNGSQWVPMYVTTAFVQSPWTTDIDGGGHVLYNVGTIHCRESLEIKESSGYPTGLVNFSDATGVYRWSIGKTAEAETGLNAGSNFAMTYYSDAGGSLGNALILYRNSGQVEIPQTLGIGVAPSYSYRLSIAGSVNITGTYFANGTPIGSQTPWLTDIDGAGKRLFNASNIQLANSLEIRSDPARDSGAVSINLTASTGLMRWGIGKTAEPETGLNAGSRLAIGRYADDGSWISTCLIINRSGNGSIVTYAPIGIAVDPPMYALDVAGDINITGAGRSYRVNGIPISAGGSGGGGTDPTTTKGDLIVRGSAPPATRMPVGNNGRVLTADSTQPLGVRWGVAGAGPIVSAYSAAAYTNVAAGTWTTLAFDSHAFDSSSGGMHSIGVNQTRFVAPTTGYYYAHCTMTMQAGSAFTAKMTVTTAGGTTDVQGSGVGVQTGQPMLASSAFLYMVAGDYVECSYNLAAGPDHPRSGTDVNGACFQFVKLFPPPPAALTWDEIAGVWDEIPGNFDEIGNV